MNGRLACRCLAAAADGTVVASIDTPADPSPAQANLRISELMYHPADPAPDSPFSAEDFEFVELVNTSATQTLDLENVAFTKGIEFTFPAMTLDPGQHVVVARDTAAFAQRYGTGILVAGQYGGTIDDFKLSNGGERLVLDDALGGEIHDFRYDDAWYPETDGNGRSLEMADPAGTALDLWDTKESWLPSAEAGGTPGAARPAAAKALIDMDETGWTESVDLAVKHDLLADSSIGGILAHRRAQRYQPRK